MTLKKSKNNKKNLKLDNFYLLAQKNVGKWIWQWKLILGSLQIAKEREKYKQSDKRSSKGIDYEFYKTFNIGRKRADNSRTSNF